MPDITIKTDETLTWLGRGGSSITSPAAKTTADGNIDWLTPSDDVEGDSSNEEGDVNRPLRNIYDNIDLVRQGLPSQLQFRTVSFANAITAHATETNDITSSMLVTARLPAIFVFDSATTSGNTNIIIDLPSSSVGTRVRLIFTNGISDSTLALITLKSGSTTIVSTGDMSRDIIVVRETSSSWDATPTEESVGGGNASLEETDPDSPRAGSFIFNTTESTLKVHNGSIWVPVGPVSGIIPVVEGNIGAFTRANGHT